LNLSNNNLSGSIPKELGNMKSLRDLNLSNNNLSGSLPAEMGNLKDLEGLNLSNNQLTGSIPPVIGNLRDLYSLYLNNNFFSGIVPGEINNLYRLRRLKLYDNRLGLLPKLTLIYLDSLWVQNNLLTFESIEPNVNIPKKFFSYFPQDSIGTKENLISCLHSNVNLLISTGGSSNKYQWYKNNSLISGAINATYIISNFQQIDTGSYACIVTNTLVPDLTLYSRPKTIKFYPSPSSAIIFGKPDVSEFEIVSYSVPLNPDLSYYWNSFNGNVLMFPSVNSVQIQWGITGTGYVIEYSRNQYGCLSDTSELRISIGTLGIVETGEIQDINIYPNPSEGLLKIEASEEIFANTTLEISDTYGKLVYIKILYNTRYQEIDLSRLPKGMYYLRIHTNNKIYHKKVLIL
jgi:hypothetical protein